MVASPMSVRSTLIPKQCFKQGRDVLYVVATLGSWEVRCNAIRELLHVGLNAVPSLLIKVHSKCVFGSRLHVSYEMPGEFSLL